MKARFINETYESIQEIHLLASEILNILFSNKSKINKDIIITKKNINISKYSIIKKLLNHKPPLIISFKDKSIKSDGEYNELTNTIFLTKDYINLLKTKDYLKYSDQNTFIILLKKTYNRILVHELQHAYDNIRSNGKYTKNKNTIKFMKNVDVYKNDLSKNPFNSNYFNLKLELSARFTESLQSLLSNGFDWKSPIKTSWKEFIFVSFDWYPKLSKYSKQRIAKKFSKYWYKKQNEISKYES